MSMTTESSLKVADCDSHVTEPPDLWTSRVSAKWRDEVPRVDPHPETGIERWHVGDIWLPAAASSAHAGWREYAPKLPQRWDDIEPGSYDARARLRRLDELGIYAQTLYPNILAFNTGVFIGMEPEAGLVCTRAYNDFLVDFASADPQRLIPIAMVPFWDVEASVAEIKRCADAGHRGILLANQYEKIGLPSFVDPHWDPIYATAQDLELPVNFHAGFGTSPKPRDTVADIDAFGKWTGDIGALAASVVTTMMNSNARALGTILTSGFCERFPRLKLVSVESGMGYLPFLLNSLDWHFVGYGVHRTGRRLPSDTFREQCYGTFWFETATLGLLEQYPGNFMFSTDYPHPTSLVPGPTSPADSPRDHIAKHFEVVPGDVARKALWENAVAVYKLPG
jgi:predicted TIM-barrel fold metal-dependent hydrolase